MPYNWRRTLGNDGNHRVRDDDTEEEKEEAEAEVPDSSKLNHSFCASADEKKDEGQGQESELSKDFGT